MPYVHKTVLERSYDEIEVGDKASCAKTITETDLMIFTGILGSLHPIHVDEEYCKKTIFGQRVVHGMLPAAFIGELLGSCMPGTNGVEISQEIKYLKPVFIGDTITATAEVVEKIDAKQRLIIKTAVTNQRGEKVIEGKAATKVFDKQG